MRDRWGIFSLFSWRRDEWVVAEKIGSAEAVHRAAAAAAAAAGRRRWREDFEKVRNEGTLSQRRYKLKRLLILQTIGGPCCFSRIRVFGSL
jgi:imidazolonepropionase-like amidohydrolase